MKPLGHDATAAKTTPLDKTILYKAYGYVCPVLSNPSCKGIMNI